MATSVDLILKAPGANGDNDVEVDGNPRDLNSTGLSATINNRANEEDVIGISEDGISDLNKSITFIQQAIDDFLEAAEASGNTLTKIPLLLAKAPGALGELIGFNYEYQLQKQNGATTLKAVYVATGETLIEASVTAAGAIVARAIVTKKIFEHFTNGNPAYKWGGAVGGAILINEYYDESGWDSAVREKFEQGYDYWENFFTKLKWAAEETNYGWDLLVDPPKQFHQGVYVGVENNPDYDDFAFVPNVESGQTFELYNPYYFISSTHDTGNDLFLRSGTLSVDPDHQKHSIIDGGAGVDTISYEGVTSFTDGLEIDLKEGVSTPRGDNYGVPLDVLDNFENAIGTKYRDIIIGNNDANSLEGGDDTDGLSGGGVSTGGAQVSALVVPGGTPSGLYDTLVGGAGADIFEFGNNSIITDATTEDFVSWGGFTKQITGGVQQWWQEGNWAYYTPYSGLLASANTLGLLSSFLGAASVLTDLRIGANFRFGLTESNQLLIEIGRGRAGTMVLNDYDLDLETGEATGNVVAYKVEHVDGKSASLAELKELINLALHAGFGQSYPEADPLMIDLDGDGLELTRERNSKAYFDFDGDGFAEHTAWAKKDDGFLVRDLNGNGKIDDISEMFGNATTGGIAALRALDSNGDSRITSADSGFASLRVWQDANGDGITDSGELKTLAQAGIKKIFLGEKAPSVTSIRGNTISAEATFTRTDNTNGTLYDVQLEHGEVDTRYLGDSTVSPAAAALPTLKGYGNLPDLDIAMTHDATLLNLVTSFKNLAATTSWTGLQNRADDILFRWAGVQGVSKVAIGTEGLDTQKLAFLEKYFGYELMPRDGAGNPIATNAAEVWESWTKVWEDATVRLSVQGPLKSLMPGAPFVSSQDHFMADTATALADGIAGAFSKLSTTSSTALNQWNNSWSKLIAGYADALMRMDNNEVRPDYIIQSLIRAMDGTPPPLTLQQLVNGLGISGVHIGTSGNDALARGTETGSQIFVGDAGNDTMTGGYGQDVYVFGRNFGHDKIIDSDTPETGDRIRLAVYTPSDVTIVRSGNDLLLTVTQTGDSITVKDNYKTPTYDLAGLPLSADHTIEEIQFADGTVYEAGDISATIGLGTDGNDTINGTAFFDEIEGLKGNDLLKGGDNGDTYYYTLGDGNDTISDIRTISTTTAPDSLALLGAITEDDLIFTRNGNSTNLTITFASGAGSITLRDQFQYTSTGYDTQLTLDNRIEVFILEHGGIIDWLQIQDKVIQTYTTDGNDTTYGFGTSDTFYVSAGDDSIVGLDGGDTYVFASGMGHDTIHDQSQYPETFISGLVGYSWGANDVMKFAPGITAADVTFSRPSEAPDLLITLKDTGDSALIAEQFTGTKLDLFNLLGVAWFNRIETFEFADGTTLTWEDILKQVTTGTDGNDSLYGAYYNDTLDGGAGDDYLSGGDESDFYLFGKGDGHDTIHDKRDNVLSSDLDEIRFKSGVTVSDVEFSRDPENPMDLIVTIKSTGDSIHIVDHYDVAYTGVFGDQYFNRIEKFVWADGTEKTANEITADIVASYNSPDSSYIIGTPADDLIDSGAGDDFMNGRDGADTYLFGEGYGHDVIYDEFINIFATDGDKVQFLPSIHPSDLMLNRAGTDLEDLVITFKNITDTLTIQKQFYYFTIGSNDFAVDNLVFADGTSWDMADIQALYFAQHQTGGDDVVDGFEGSDTLTGGTGNDMLRGGDGADTYVFSPGFGQDTIDDEVRYVTRDYDNDTIKFEPGITAANTLLSRAGDDNDLVISFTNSTDKITVTDHFNGNAYHGIDFITFADGTVWSNTIIKQKILEQSSSNAANVLHGFDNSDDNMNGQGGNDYMMGYLGNDTLTGGTGNDFMDGGEGDDTYIINKAEGWDVIDDYYGYGDVLSFGDGISWSNTTFYRCDNDILIKLAGGGKVIVVDGINSGGSMEKLQFADGTTKTSLDVKNRFAAVTTQSGTSGNDTLTGTAGNDSMKGGDGNDTFIINKGAGVDIVYGGFGTDAIRFGEGISWDTTGFYREGWNVYLGLSGGGIVIIKDAFSPYYGIQNFYYADGTIKTQTELMDKLTAQSQTSGDDWIVGFSRDDTLVGKAGNDSMDGGDGDDTFIINKGQGMDTVYGDWGDDTISFGAGISWANTSVFRHGEDAILSLAGGGSVTLKDAFTVYGVENLAFADGTVFTQEDLKTRILAEGKTDGNDIIHGFSESESLEGGAGDDWIDGGDGDNTLEGGAGADTLEGGDWVNTNTASYASSPLAVYVNLKLGLSHGGDATGDVFIDINNLIGSAYDDKLIGDNGKNSLSGGVGNDTLDGGDGADTLNGGAGNDTADYSLSSAGVTISLLKNPASGGSAEGDMLISIENLIGSAYGDSLVGKANANLIDGGKGNDTLDGGAGADTLQGGIGFDTLTYANATGGVAVNLNTGAGSGAEAEGDVISGIEQVIGSAYNDSLTGTLSNEVLNGDSGNDTIRGGGGADVLLGGDGVDNLIGNSGNDTLDGGGERDILSGGSGADVFKFSLLTDSYHTGSHYDRITDFVVGTDKIDLTGLGFTGLDSDGGSTETGELRLTYSSTSNRTYVRTDQLDFEFYLDGDYTGTMTNADFIF